MITREHADVIVIGAGPAGSACALRLLALGHRVAVVERRPFPRPQVGESLSPGIWNLLEYLDALAAADGFLRGLPARIAWEHAEPDVIAPGQRAPGVMVDRGMFDARLLALVRARGGRVLQPARIRHVEGEPGAWQLLVAGERSQWIWDARLIIEATGRGGQSARDRAPTAPPTLALWADLPARALPFETRVEALPGGWLWGSPRPGAGYRAMGFVELRARGQRGAGGPEAVLRELMAAGRLFAPAAAIPFAGRVRTCSAAPYLDVRPWRPGRIKVGEAAFALDPLSSSGVEKAMRFALQTAVAANTVLGDAQTETLARDFYESQLVESAAAHLVWTHDHYHRAWPGQEHEFWRQRSRPEPVASESGAPHEVLARLHQACAVRERLARGHGTAASGSALRSADPAMLGELWQAPVALGSELRVVKAPCVVGDRVALRAAVSHPGLDRPLAFLEAHELVPLLQAVPLTRNLAELVGLWSTHMPAATAARIAGWLLYRGLLQRGSTSPPRQGDPS